MHHVKKFQSSVIAIAIALSSLSPSLAFSSPTQHHQEIAPSKFSHTFHSAARGAKDLALYPFRHWSPVEVYMTVLTVGHGYLLLNWIYDARQRRLHSRELEKLANHHKQFDDHVKGVACQIDTRRLQLQGRIFNLLNTPDLELDQDTIDDLEDMHDSLGAIFTSPILNAQTQKDQASKAIYQINALEDVANRIDELEGQ